MLETNGPRVTAFLAHARVASGSLLEVALAVKAAFDADPSHVPLVFDDATGELVDLNLSGTADQLRQRMKYRIRALTWTPPTPEATTRGRGRPRLGVVGREVTLLPRHWEWLESQPGGASAALRRLVDEARKTSGPRDRARAGQEATHRFLTAIAGDAPDFEDALRALFANDRPRFEEIVATWSPDVHAYAIRLAYPDDADEVIS